MNMGGSNQLNKKEKDDMSAEEPVIRTMAKDIKRLSKQGVPPEELPVSSVSELAQEKQQEVEQERIKVERERAKKETEEIEKAREEAEKQRITQQKAEQERIRKENDERMRIERERVKQEAEGIERRKKQAEEQRKIEQERIERERIEQKRIERIKVEQEKAVEEAEEIEEEAQNLPKANPPLVGKKSPIKIIIICLIVIFITGSLGGFIYWWNYLKLPAPLPATHYQCQDYKCISVEGEGTDQCQINQDCEPAEPVIPEALIPVDETKTIELIIGQENLIPDLLKSIIFEEQATSTFRRILIKSISQDQRRYMSLNDFNSALGISLPNNIYQSVADSDIESGNYTLFFHNQIQGNRFGIVIEMLENSILIQELKDWENTMTTDLNPIFLRDEIPSAATEEFQDNVYQGISIRYLNFSTPDLSIDYAIVNNKLIIATSRESMYAVIDCLRPVSEN